MRSMKSTLAALLVIVAAAAAPAAATAYDSPAHASLTTSHRAGYTPFCHAATSQICRDGG